MEQEYFAYPGTCEKGAIPKNTFPKTNGWKLKGGGTRKEEDSELGMMICGMG